MIRSKIIQVFANQQLSLDRVVGLGLFSSLIQTFLTSIIGVLILSGLANIYIEALPLVTPEEIIEEIV